LSAVLYGCKTWSLTLTEEQIKGYVRVGCWGEYMDLEDRKGGMLGRTA